MIRPTLLTLALLLAASCGPTPQKRAEPVINSPAGLNCTQHGGELVVRQSNMGQKGYCLLPDGRALDMWEYFRQMNP